MAILICIKLKIGNFSGEELKLPKNQKVSNNNSSI
jgi:hypothetical protein